jgi:hypothetical protein
MKDSNLLLAGLVGVLLWAAVFSAFYYASISGYLSGTWIDRLAG